MLAPFRLHDSLLALSLLTFLAPFLRAAEEVELDPRDAITHCEISLPQAIEKALAKQPGHAIAAKLEAEFDEDELEIGYEVLILSKDFRLFEVVVDVKTGTIVEVDEEKGDDAREEARAYRNGIRHCELTLVQLLAKASGYVKGRAVATKLEFDDDGPECEVRVANGRVLFELDLEARAGHLLEIELVGRHGKRDDDEHGSGHHRQGGSGQRGDDEEEEMEEEEAEEESEEQEMEEEGEHEEHEEGHRHRQSKTWSADSFRVFRPIARGLRFSPDVTHAYFPLKRGTSSLLAAEDEFVVRTVLPETTKVAGIDCTVLQESEFEDGKLVEISRNFFAQDPAGNVWYFGETVDQYEGGKLTGHSGAWLVGKNAKEPCLFMPAELEAGFRFRRENSPPDAQEFNQIGGTKAMLKLGGRTLENLLVVFETDKLGKWQEAKFYAKGVGLVSENGELTLQKEMPEALSKQLRALAAEHAELRNIWIQ